MNSEQLTHGLQALAEDLVPADVNLWPTIAAQFTAPPRQPRRLRLVSAALLTLLAALALTLATPQGRALAQAALQFFTRAPADLQTLALAPPATAAVVTPDPASMLDAHLTVAEAAALAGFAVRQPAYLPAAFAFSGASYDPDGGRVRLFYVEPSGGALVLQQAAFTVAAECALCGQVGASAAVQSVPVGSVSGEYVVGVWKLTDDGQVWEPDPYLQTLRWQEGQQAFELLFMGPPDSLSQTEMLAIAASVK
jgi:hypothetical protein